MFEKAKIEIYDLNSAEGIYTGVIENSHNENEDGEWVV